MTPLVVLLMGLAATTTVADGEHAWRRRNQLDGLRRRLGLWPLDALPGSIARRIEWIRQQFGVEAAVASTRVAVILGEPNYVWATHEHEGKPPVDRAARIAPFLPWFAWRWTQGDVPEELRRVLLHPNFAPKDAEGKLLPYSKDEAWSTLASLVHWADYSRADLFQHTWAQAIAAEEDWFPTSLKTWEGADWNVPAGEVVYRYLWEAEEGPWTVQRHDDYDEMYAIRKLLRLPDGRSGGVIDVLKRPDGEPVVVIDLATRYTSHEIVGVRDIKGEYSASTLEWAQGGDDEDILKKLKAYLEHEFGDPSNWGSFDGPIIAVFASEGDELLELLETNPELFTSDRNEDQGAADFIASQACEFDHRFISRWADLANIYPDDWPALYPRIASYQTPTQRLIEWMRSGEWKDELADKEIPHKELQDHLPGIIRQFEYGHGDDSDADITSTSGEHDEVLPWEIQLWDIYKHPTGPELEVKLQVFIWFDWEENHWVTSAKAAGQFRPTSDPSTWQTSEAFDEFEFASIVEQSQWGYRELDSSAMKDLHHDPFETRGYGTTSLDEALKEGWEFVADLDEAEIDTDPIDWRQLFPITTLADPSEDLEIVDVFESMELLGTR